MHTVARDCFLLSFRRIYITYFIININGMLLTFIDHDPPMQWLGITILHILLTIKHDDIQCSLWWYEQHGTITDHMKWQRQNVEQKHHGAGMILNPGCMEGIIICCLLWIMIELALYKIESR